MEVGLVKEVKRWIIVISLKGKYDVNRRVEGEQIIKKFNVKTIS